MSNSERLLQELWAADEPPARDPAFELAVMQRVNQRRLLVELVWLTVSAAAGAAALWALAPIVEQLAAGVRWDSQAIGVWAAGLFAAAAIGLWASDRPQALPA